MNLMFVRMKHPNQFSAAVFMLSLSACGGGGSGPTTTDTGPKMATFTGSARIAPNGVCSSSAPAHRVEAGPGTLTVTLTQAGEPRMKLQVCATTELDHRNCTVPPFAVLPVGQSVTATVKGGRSQSVVLYPERCGGPDETPTDLITYSISVVHPG
ncbi:MAG: hypothetical protein KBH14_09410 [Vicinamibacteria bacterium]|jgi:hypothetical protein|nr:hypothetical protein [Vicinamibacteria bacterium]MBP9946601.1 hypothetical protein [Vicinamibacteria bacterium]